MRHISDETWTRRGMSILWNPDKLANVCKTIEVVPLRTFLALTPWPEELPSSNGNALVVAGLDGALDAMEPSEGEAWLEQFIKPRILDFQHNYQGQAALVFWIPSGKHRLQYSHATGSYAWNCQPQAKQQIPIGRCLWAGAEVDVLRVMDAANESMDFDGPAWIGLYHPRIS
jgi:hypothetical protein